MAPPPNFFSLLDGEEGDVDFGRLTSEAKEAKKLAKEERKAARLAAMEKADKGNAEELVEKDQNQISHSRQFDNGRNVKRQGAEYHGRGPRRNGEAVGSQMNGYQQKQGPVNGFQHDNHQSNGNRRDNHVGDGVAPNDGYGFRGNNRGNDSYQPNYRRNNGYQGNDGYDNRGNRAARDGYQGNYRSSDYQVEGNDGYGYQGNRTARDGSQGNYRSRDYQGEGNDGYGHQVSRRGRDGYQGNYRSRDGYQGNYKERDGYEGGKHDDAYVGDDQSQISSSQSEDGWSLAHRRSSKGRGFNRGHYRNKSQASEANEKRVNDGQDERKPKTGERDDEKDAGDQVSETPESKEVIADGDVVNANGDAVNAEGGIVASEVSKDAKTKQKKVSVNINKHWSEMTEDEKKAVRAKRAEERAKEIEEDKKLLTLEQYEKIRLEKKRALLEASKTEVRKVVLDKDLDSMQPIHKKKEDVSIVEPQQQSEKDQLKKKNSLDKDEKAVESIIIKELFMNSAAGGRRFERRGGRFEGRSIDGGQKSRNWGREKNGVKLEDESQFPALGGSA